MNTNTIRASIEYKKKYNRSIESYKLHWFEKLSSLVISISSIISFIFTLLDYNNIPNEYIGFIFMPIIFLFFYNMVYIPILKSRRYKIVTYFLILSMWPKMTLLPLLSALTGNYNGFSYVYATSSSISLANFLIIHEFIISSIFLYFLIRLSKPIQLVVNKNIMKGNKLVYLAFITLGILIYFFIGRANNLIHFFIIPISDGGRLGDITSTPLVLARQIIILSIAVIAMWIISSCKKAYDAKRKNIYIYIATFSTLINISIIVGERRSAIIYSGFVFTYMLVKTFPKRKKKIMILTLGTAIIVFGLMSIYKFFAAFEAGSYYNSLTQTKIDLEWIYRTLNPYLGSPLEVGATIDMSNLVNIPWYNILFDFARSTFGLSFLLKGQGTLTSAMFNHYIYSNPFIDVGHVITSVGYGYIYFGAILSPLILCLNIFIATKIENLFIKARSYETMYLWGYMLIRFSTLGASTPPLISGATIQLFTAGLLFFIASILNGYYVGQKPNIKNYNEYIIKEN